MTTKEVLENKIRSFATLSKNWDGYNGEKIPPLSIGSALKILNKLIEENINLETIGVFPLSDGGIQFDIGEHKGIEIHGKDIEELYFDNDFNIIKTKYYKIC